MIGQSEILARFGGEEFVILLPETGIEAGITLAEHARQSLESKVINMKVLSMTFGQVLESQVWKRMKRWTWTRSTGQRTGRSTV